MYGKFEKLLKWKNITAYKVSKDTNIPYVLFANWKTGKSAPKADKLIRIAHYFGVTLDFFYSDSPLPDEPSLDEQLKGISFALFGPQTELSDDMKRDIIDYYNMRVAFEAQKNSRNDYST
jgi:repressor LexA